MIYYLVGFVSKLFSFYSLFLLVYALLSWFPGAYQSKIGQWIAYLVEPVLTPFRRFNLQFAGLDFTIFVAILFVNLAKTLLIEFLILLL